MLANALRAAAIAVLMLVPLSATAAPWQVTQASGPVFIGSPTAQHVALTRSAILPEGAMVTTGASGRAALARGAETIVIGPNSVIALPAEIDGRTTILERSGAIEFDVEHQNVQHFSVETPFLAAVVKGTHFTVTVDDAGANVDVGRGLVEVTNLATGEVADIPPGQHAGVAGTGARLSVGGVGRQAEIRQSAPRPVMVAALASGELAALRGGAPQPNLGAPAERRDGNGADVLVAAAGGTDGPGSGGAGPADSKGADLGANTNPIASRQLLQQPRHSDDFTLTDAMIAGMIAASAFLALGIAFVRARFS